MNSIQIDFSTIVEVLLAFSALAGAFGKILLDQFEKRQDERDKLQAEARDKADKALTETLQQHFLEEKKTADKIIDLERDFLGWKAEMPLNYVRRDDFIRSQSMIETKIDGLALRIENAMLKRGPKDD